MKLRTETKRLIVHHTASPLDTTLEDLHNWHVEEKGWDAIGYHRVVTADGTMHEARPIQYQGAHAYGNNGDSVGICLVGNNTIEEDRWRPAQVQTLFQFWMDMQAIYPGITVCGHRDVAGAATECPGLNVRGMLLGPTYGRT